jgi:hypothetical protein
VSDTRLPDNNPGRNSNLATVTITVRPVNDAPKFVKGANPTVYKNAGAQTVAGWATGISPGPANESGQALNFVVTNNNAALFSVQPSVAPNGTLTYTPQSNCTGTATVTVKIHDNGGTAYGGVDTSAAQTFTITVLASATMTTAGPADLYFSLKQSADIGTKFDVKAEVLKNSTVIASGQLNAITLGSGLNFSGAVMKAIALSAVSLPATFGGADTLSLKVSVRVASSSSHATAIAKLWFNVPASSPENHLHARVNNSDVKYFLWGMAGNPSSLVLKKNTAAAGPAQPAEVYADKSGFKPFGTWNIATP